VVFCLTPIFSIQEMSCGQSTYFKVGKEHDATKRYVAQTKLSSQESRVDPFDRFDLEGEVLSATMNVWQDLIAEMHTTSRAPEVRRRNKAVGHPD
jgi:hypothetical protein